MREDVGRAIFQKESLKKVTLVPRRASQNLMRPKSRESEKSFFRGSPSQGKAKSLSSEVPKEVAKKAAVP
jgi:hypothetical protein